MSLKDIFNKISHEVKAAKGEETKDKVFSNEQTFANESEARQQFERAKQKLFDVNGWSRLHGINSTFQLYDVNGQPLTKNKAAVDDFMKIILPATTIENWVQVIEVKDAEDTAEFTVKPSPEPGARQQGDAVKHFFTSEASSTFRVERQGNKLVGYEIGQNERANNNGQEAGDRAVLNTLVAEGGWAGFQDIQWNRLTAFLVHLEEAPDA